MAFLTRTRTHVMEHTNSKLIVQSTKRRTYSGGPHLLARRAHTASVSRSLSSHRSPRRRYIAGSSKTQLLKPYRDAQEDAPNRSANEKEKNAKPELFCIQQCNDESVHKVRERLAVMAFVRVPFFGTFCDFPVDFGFGKSEAKTYAFYAYDDGSGGDGGDGGDGDDGGDGSIGRNGGKARKMTVTTRTPMNIRIRLWAHSFATCYDFRSGLLCISLPKLLQPIRRQ